MVAGKFVCFHMHGPSPCSCRTQFEVTRRLLTGVSEHRKSCLAAGGQGDFDSPVLRLSYTSLTTPSTTLDHNLATSARRGHFADRLSDTETRAEWLECTGVRCKMLCCGAIH